jgi:hypothetical protein
MRCSSPSADALSISRWKLYELPHTARPRPERVGTRQRALTQALDEFIGDLAPRQPDWRA